MVNSLSTIDKYVHISDTLAMSGQPSLRQFNLLRQADVQMVIHLEIQEVEPVIRDEYTVVTNHGMLYENIPVSFNEPQYTSYQSFANLLDNYYAKFNVWVHCTAGYCTSGFMVPYLVSHYDMSIEDAMAKSIIKQFSPHWQSFIDNIIENNYSTAQ